MTETQPPGVQHQRPRRTGVIAGGVAVALLTAGGVTALAMSGGLGSGTKQPADVLPGSAIGYVRVDLDPGMAQKVAAFRLVDKLPDAKKALTAQDPKKAMWEWAVGREPKLGQAVNYTDDIEPWLGDRVGVATLAPQADAGEPTWVVAVQVKDEEKAKNSITALMNRVKAGRDTTNPSTSPSGWFSYSPDQKSRSGNNTSSRTSAGGSGDGDAKVEPVFFAKDGYVLLTDKKTEQSVRQAVDAGTLADRQEFRDDMERLGEAGVATVWVDQQPLLRMAQATGTSAGLKPAGAGALSPGSTGTLPDDLVKMAGRQAMALRFADDHVELAGFSRQGPGAPKVDTAPAEGLGQLPSATAAFVSLGGGGQAFTALWPTYEKALRESNPDFERQLAQFEQQSGLDVPGDIATLLGRQLDVVVGDDIVSTVKAPSSGASGGTQQLPSIGLRLRGDTAASEPIVTRLLDKAGSSGGAQPSIERKTDGDVLSLALTSDYLDTLAQQGDLGSNPGLHTVIPDLDKQHLAAFVDLNKVESAYLDGVPQEHRDLVGSLRAVGYSATPSGDDGYDVRLRLAVD